MRVSVLHSFLETFKNISKENSKVLYTKWFYEQTKLTLLLYAIENRVSRSYKLSNKNAKSTISHFHLLLVGTFIE